MFLDCAGKVCYNGGTLNPNKCKWTCPLYKGGTCNKSKLVFLATTSFLLLSIGGSMWHPRYAPHPSRSNLFHFWEVLAKNLPKLAFCSKIRGWILDPGSSLISFVKFIVVTHKFSLNVIQCLEDVDLFKCFLLQLNVPPVIPVHVLIFKKLIWAIPVFAKITSKYTFLNSPI